MMICPLQPVLPQVLPFCSICLLKSTLIFNLGIQKLAPKYCASLG